MKSKPYIAARLYEMGSDVYGLPSQETYLDSHNHWNDTAKINTFSEYTK